MACNPIIRERYPEIPSPSRETPHDALDSGMH